jgi:hypothetical protein
MECTFEYTLINSELGGEQGRTPVSCVLTTTSTHFRDLPFLSKLPLEVPPMEHLTITSNSQDFFTILQAHDTSLLIPKNWDRVESALDVCVRFGFWMFPSIIAAGLAKPGGPAERAPWAVFVFASNFESPPLARYAISQLHRDANITSMSPATFDPALFAEVQGTYVAALYRAMGAKGWTTVLDKESDWEEIAMAFKV